MTTILEIEGLRKSFGGVLVTDDLSVSLQKGEALGVVGPNGAGKTTMLNLIGGAVRPDAGRVLFEGQDITHLARHERCRRGLGRTYQVPRPFVGMTAFENVLVGATHGRGKSERASYQTAVDALERADLLHHANTVAGSLTLLDRKRLELARALATEPRVLLLDEIAGGLTEAEVNELIETIRALRSEGMSIIWIEHIVHALLAVVDRLMAIDFGKLLIEGDPHEVICSPEVEYCYMGTERV
ncbi:MAG: ABC transporter ATP-binding protein [Actinobacteria bacterium]|nr:ABC transporter ATP-binding protein [Actinomycetota bacterium]